MTDINAALFAADSDEEEDEKPMVQTTVSAPQVAPSTEQSNSRLSMRQEIPVVKIQTSLKRGEEQKQLPKKMNIDGAQAVRFNVQQDPRQAQQQHRQNLYQMNTREVHPVVSFKGSSSAGGSRGQEHYKGQHHQQQQGDLALLLKDICQLINSETRSRFKAFVQDLKQQRDSGKIDSLTAVLIAKGPEIVGNEIWAKALNNQKYHRQRAAARSYQQPSARSREPESQSYQQNHHAQYRKRGPAELSQLKNNTQESQQRGGSIGAFSLSSRLLASSNQQYRGQQRSSMQIAVSSQPRPGDAFAEAKAKKQKIEEIDIISEAELFKGTEPKPHVQQAITSATHWDFLHHEAAWTKLRQATDAVSTDPPLIALDDALKSSSNQNLRVELPRHEAKRAASCLVLSRATWIFVTEALEALCVLSRRRTNDEAKRITAISASRPCALGIQWEPRQQTILSHRLRCAWRAALFDTMLDDDLAHHELKNIQPPGIPRLLSPTAFDCIQDDDQRKNNPANLLLTWSQADRLARKRQLEPELQALGSAHAVAQRSRSNAESQAKRVKIEHKRISIADPSSTIQPPPPSTKHTICKQDVIAFLASRPRFNALLFTS
mmetsp:Transcript_8438/g.12884  ORF Transcript_8438/g.12884 Transcript_8438/m.12884 type:complete len:605 (+) Transcript_8438:77-1891(+)